MEFKNLKTEQVLLNPGNPRFGFTDDHSYDELSIQEIEEKQEKIMRLFELTQDDDVGKDNELGRQFSYHRQGLKDSIEKINVKEPIKVQKKSNNRYLVVDGNTRLSTVKSLHKQNSEDERFKTIPCIILGEFNNEKFNQYQLTAHVVGSKPWDIYCRAAFLYDLKMRNAHEFSSILESIGRANSNRFKKEIAAYSLMQDWKKVCTENNIESVGDKNLLEFDSTKFSYFYEFQIRISQFDDIEYSEKDFVKHMRQNLIDRGTDVRRLTSIWENPGDPEKRIRNIFLTKGSEEAIKELDKMQKDNKEEDILKIVRNLDACIRSMDNAKREKFMEKDGQIKLEKIFIASRNLEQFHKDLEIVLAATEEEN